MVNFNGTIQDNSAVFVESNRGFLVGDAVFETIKVVNNQVLFLEDHYFRLMASMRICRMEIPMLFTMEYFEEQILQLVASFSQNQSITCCSIKVPTPPISKMASTIVSDIQSQTLSG